MNDNLKLEWVIGGGYWIDVYAIERVVREKSERLDNGPEVEYDAYGVTKNIPGFFCPCS